MRLFLSLAFFAAFLMIAPAEALDPSAALDSDHDGLSDAVETSLLNQFAPEFLTSLQDCSGRPAEFVPFKMIPAVQEENGTIYGQAFPLDGEVARVELHFYHLWRSDCGENGHSGDAEHVSVLVTRGVSAARDDSANWKALYWYAAAHEDTVCDSSQIARAETVDGVTHGPRVWISRGKHASFLTENACGHGCGVDECTDAQPLRSSKVVNLGELGSPMSGATWAGAPNWPLATKMGRSDFSEAHIARVDAMDATGIALAGPEHKQMKAVILSGNAALGGAATGAQATDGALTTADVHTANALNSASEHTSRSVGKSLRSVKKALGATVRAVGETLDVPAAK